jgi:chromosome segregation protein
MVGYTVVEAEDEALRTEAEELRKQIEQLGPVNPLAIEEHEEETKRLEFLTTQRADLAEAQIKLHAAIKEIDVTARELFLTTFATVRAHFRQIFITLFGGGECDLRLRTRRAARLRYRDPRERRAARRPAHPPALERRTRPRRAVAALRHLPHQAQPVLPAGRSGRAARRPEHRSVREDAESSSSQSTQFIVITHNPRTTTEAADAVYGVTMQEPGVSSIVSVRMNGPAVDDTPTAA